jgi:hypothetical protein
VSEHQLGKSTTTISAGVNTWSTETISARDWQKDFFVILFENIYVYSIFTSFYFIKIAKRYIKNMELMDILGLRPKKHIEVFFQKCLAFCVRL